MPNTSLTLSYDALLSSTLFYYERTLQDQISTANAFLYCLMNGEGEDSYEEVEDIGDRMQIPLMYELGVADTYSGYDELNVDPIDGVTSAFFPWCQLAVPITISALEEKKNRGEAKIYSLLQGKVKQAVGGIQQLFNRSLLRGNVDAGGLITDPYTSSTNGSSFVDPLFKVIAKTPTNTIGSVSGNTNTWWRNQTKDFNGLTTYASFLAYLRNLRNKCSKGIGGPPDLHIVDQDTYELYERALAAAHRNPSYQVADIPFDNIAFYRAPVTWDEFVPDVDNGTLAVTEGTWGMINTQFWHLKVHAETNFAATEFQRPVGQDAKVAHILWLGGYGCSNRRKHGVGYGIPLSIAA